MGEEDSILNDIIYEFIDKFSESDADLEEYCKKYPSLKDKLQQRFRIIKLIEEGLKEEVWSGKRIGEYIIVEEIGQGRDGICISGNTDLLKPICSLEDSTLWICP
jgi:hypothetical protein